jgi:ribosome-binding factor A
VSQALREELEELIVYELTDPRIQVAGIAEVLMSPDARRARIRLILQGDEAAQKASLEALDHAKGYVRREIASRLDLFRVPDLEFEAAMSAGLSPRMPHLLRRVRRGRPRPDSEAQENPEAPSRPTEPEA